MRKFRVQLLLSYLPLVLVPVLIVGLVTRDAAQQGLSLLITQGARYQSRALAPCLSDYYRIRGTWDELNRLLKTTNRFFLLNFAANPPLDPETQRPLPDSAIILTESGFIGCMQWRAAATRINVVPPPLSVIPAMPAQPPRTPPSPNSPTNSDETARSSSSSYNYKLTKGLNSMPAAEQVLITNPDGVIVAGTNNAEPGKRVSLEVLAQSEPIIVNGMLVGRLVIGTALGELGQSQRDLLDMVNTSLVLSGAVSVALAVGLALWMSGQIASPVRTLMHGVKRLAMGEWSSPLTITSTNEFGDLTNAFNNMAGEITHQQQLNRQMVADVAHDLRTPLSAMMLELEAIDAGFQTPAQATSSLREEITWLQRMVDDLRMLSLMDADQIHLRMEMVPMHDFMSRLYDFWLTMAEDHERQLKLDIPKGLPMLCIDPMRIRQVLSNLIDNAIQHTRPGDAIMLRAWVEGERMIVQVIDQGEGIQPDDLPHIFDRFYRADPARRRSSSSGSGLGLSIARRLVEMHNGTIAVQSRPSIETVFTVTLPLPK